MKIGAYRSLMIAVLTRNEHCPPHVHAGSRGWEARFEFSFWHSGVRLWDVVPIRSRSGAATLEGIRQTIMQPANLLRARSCWWASTQTTCLLNQIWDASTQEVMAGKRRTDDTFTITGASFDATANRTVLTLKDLSDPMEIAL